LSDPADQATVALPEPAPAGAPVRTERGRPKPSSPARSRQARVVVRKVGPWSVLKISFLFYLCVMVVIIGAMMILYAILGAIGVLDNTAFLVELGFGDDFKIHGDWLFSRGLAIGLGLVVLWTLINVFIVLMYNLLSDIVGGIEVTLSERR
jgi:hypothetical protein